MGAIAGLLRTPGLGAAVYNRCLRVLGAIIYGRPALADDSVVDSVKALFDMAGIPPATLRLAGDVLKFFIGTPAAPPAVAALEELLAEPRLAPAVHQGLIEPLAYAASWRMELIGPERLIALASAEHLARHRNFLLANLIERAAFWAPEAFTPALLDRLADVYHGEPSFRYLLYYLGGRPATPPETAGAAAALMAGRFPLHGTVRARLGVGRRRVLVVHNIDDGQGDEIVRVGTLTQALLDFNPALEAVLVTKRIYLYDNDRVMPVSITDDGRLRLLLDQAFDGVIDFSEPEVPAVNYRPELESLIRQHVSRRQPFLFAASRKGYHHFTYETVTIAGEPYAAALGLDRPRAPNIYETTYRLVAELGFPLRTGEETPRTASLFVGKACGEAEREWRRLTLGARRARAHPGRPIAMVNPFGGRGALKGYVPATRDGLAREIRALVAEGFFVVLLPNGTPWGTRAFASGVVRLLPAEARASVVVAPDPQGRPADRKPRRASAPETLSHADRIMRCFKYFAIYADLAVTVEGWLMHLAHQLGRPYRLLLLPYSHPFAWHPYGSDGHQRVVTNMNATWNEGSATTDLLVASARPPLPGYPRKDVLRFVLQGLGELDDPAALAPLFQACASPDRDVRATAAEALGRHGGPKVKEVLLAALEDRAAGVRSAAARGLLEMRADCRRELGADHERMLRCHILVSARRWRAVLASGPGALRALSLALEDEDVVVRREAAWVASQLIRGCEARRAPASRHVGMGHGPEGRTWKQRTRSSS